MLNMTIKNLWTRKVRSALCILVVMVSVFLNGIVMIMNAWMYQARVEAPVRHMIDRICVRQTGSAEYPPTDTTISQETAEAILARFGNPAESMLMLYAHIGQDAIPFIPSAVVIGVPAGSEGILLEDIQAAEGVNRFNAGEMGDVAIMGERAARSLKASVGHEIVLNGQAVRVIGILEGSTMISVDISVIMPLETVQRIFGQEGKVSVLLMRPGEVDKITETVTVLRRDYPALRFVTLDEMLAETKETIRAPMMYMKTMTIMGMLAAVAVIMSTMFMAVVERTREFGTLRALGARRRSIVGMVFAEALLLGLIGGLPGIGLSLLMGRVMEAFTQPSVIQFLQILAGAVVIALVAGAYPAWRAARVEPVEALRYE